jgi:hypothetical protein
LTISVNNLILTFFLLGDIIANVLLVAAPVYMLWDSTLPKGPRWMIRVVFTTSIMTTAISVMHAVHVMGPNRVLEGYTAHFEVRNHKPILVKLN